MFDSATLNRAAHVIRTVNPRLPADAALRQELAANRNLSAAARSAVSRAVFSYYRWLSWLREADSLQSRLDDALTRQRQFETSPQSVKVEALAARAVPPWLAEEVVFPGESLLQLQKEPRLWIRARPGTRDSLSSELKDATPPDGATPLLQFFSTKGDALRFFGTRDLFSTDGFKTGKFEIQDLASQWVGHACAPQPGQVWWDACAGEGGKSLHLADQMDNKGVLWASDRSERRLEQLKRRFARAQLFNVRVATWEGATSLPTKTKFDGVLVDAPCSGVGTWQRNPHARWTTTLADVQELAGVQTRMLDSVAASLKSGGRLVYAVCTLTRSETTAVADQFTQTHPEFTPTPIFPGVVDDTQQTLWPHELEANGMFLAAWTKK
ncbi:MAG TPA: RsmB/NOP family class I SAM-dependent RNA methyltransferase [Opitutaceae bacterium]|nr:RsmB/NOP family class I SAM-dependent RNA methyltransferase [Opitutaceae bacterium]